MAAVMASANDVKAQWRRKLKIENEISNIEISNE
jgi:hypothetical protein